MTLDGEKLTAEVQNLVEVWLTMTNLMLLIIFLTILNKRKGLNLLNQDQRQQQLNIRRKKAFGQLDSERVEVRIHQDTKQEKILMNLTNQTWAVKEKSSLVVNKTITKSHMIRFWNVKRCYSEVSQMLILVLVALFSNRMTKITLVIQEISKTKHMLNPKKLLNRMLIFPAFLLQLIRIQTQILIKSMLLSKAQR